MPALLAMPHVCRSTKRQAPRPRQHRGSFTINDVAQSGPEKTADSTISANLATRILVVRQKLSRQTVKQGRLRQSCCEQRRPNAELQLQAVIIPDPRGRGTSGGGERSWGLLKQSSGALGCDESLERAIATEDAKPTPFRPGISHGERQGPRATPGVLVVKQSLTQTDIEGGCRFVRRLYRFVSVHAPDSTRAAGRGERGDDSGRAVCRRCGRATHHPNESAAAKSRFAGGR